MLCLANKGVWISTIRQGWIHTGVYPRESGGGNDREEIGMTYRGKGITYEKAEMIFKGDNDILKYKNLFKKNRLNQS